MWLLFALLLHASCASVSLPTSFASAWEVKTVGMPPGYERFDIMIWADGDSMHEKIAFLNETVISPFPDYLVLGSVGNRSCFLFNEANFSCLVQCEGECGPACKACQSFVPLFSEFDDPQTLESPGCGGLSTATLFNVTVLHSSTSILCFDGPTQRPLFYTRTSGMVSFSASVVSFVAGATSSDFDRPPYCNCTAQQSHAAARTIDEEAKSPLFSMFLSK